jgi:type II secretory pathway pseudopilin PulG
MLKNQKGMSLVSVLVAIALTGVLATILVNLTEQQNRQQKKALVDGELVEVYAHFVRMINQAEPCNATFIGLQKGDTLAEFRYGFDPDQDPFASVGENFRNTKIVLQEMKLLTDAEVTARNIPLVTKAADGSTTVVFEATFKRPEGTIGGTQVKKTFDVRVAIGRGEIIKMPDSTAISDNCSNSTGGDGCIASFETGECNTTNPASEMIDAGTFWYGLCFDPTPASASDDIIIRCQN